MSGRERADVLLVRRGIFETRAKAQAAIAAGLVFADGAMVRKASEGVPVNAEINASPAHPYVSRGGVKLAAALEAFGVDPAGRECLDVGASTGGFTEVLVQRGAARVVAVDSGSGQLHPSLRGHPRVVSLESTDIRTLATSGLDPAPTLAVIDVSFISLSLVLPAVAALLAPAGGVIALIKPQFEVGRAFIGRGGLVKDAAAQAGAVEKVRATLEELGLKVADVIDSPVTGGDGNREFLICARRPA